MDSVSVAAEPDCRGHHRRLDHRAFGHWVATGIARRDRKAGRGGRLRPAELGRMGGFLPQSVVSLTSALRSWNKENAGRRINEVWRGAARPADPGDHPPGPPRRVRRTSGQGGVANRHRERVQPAGAADCAARRLMPGPFLSTARVWMPGARRVAISAGHGSLPMTIVWAALVAVVRAEEEEGRTPPRSPRRASSPRGSRSRASQAIRRGDATEGRSTSTEGGARAEERGMRPQPGFRLLQAGHTGATLNSFALEVASTGTFGTGV